MPQTGTNISTPMDGSFPGPVDEKTKVSTVDRLALVLVKRWLGMIVYDTDLGVRKRLINNPGTATTTELDWEDAERDEHKNQTPFVITASGLIDLDKKYDATELSISGGDTNVKRVSIVANPTVYGGQGYRYNTKTPNNRLVGDLSKDIHFLFCRAGTVLEHDVDPGDNDVPATPVRSQYRPLSISSGENMEISFDTYVPMRYDENEMKWFVTTSLENPATPTIQVRYQISVVTPGTELGKIKLTFAGGVSSIDWGDGNVDPLASNVEKTHQYGSAGTYNVVVYCSENTTIFNIIDSFVVGTVFNIESLVSLKELYCNDNNISTINVAPLVGLTRLNCANNNISVLDVTNLTLLTELTVSNNNISVLNVTNLTSLVLLFCSNNNISVLNVTSLVLLTTLNCTNNTISTLNVTNLTALSILSCANNVGITVLDVATLTALTAIFCQGCSISVLNVTNLTSLVTLECQNNNISILNVTNLTALQNLNCSANNISILDVALLTALVNLRCGNNSISVLNVTNLTLLQLIDCSDNTISVLNLTNLTALVNLECFINSITVLNFQSTNINYTDWRSNGMDFTQNDNAWIALDAATTQLNGYADSSGNAAPSAASATARNNLDANKFWDVII